MENGKENRKEKEKKPPLTPFCSQISFVFDSSDFENVNPLELKKKNLKKEKEKKERRKNNNYQISHNEVEYLLLGIQSPLVGFYNSILFVICLFAFVNFKKNELIQNFQANFFVLR